MANNIQRYTQEWKKDENGVILIPDEILLSGAIEKTKNELVFSLLGGRRSQPLHKGTKMVQRVKIPILHPENHLDNGINANAAVFMKNRWYAYDSNNAQIGDPEGYRTKADADAVTGADAANTKSSAGTCYFGDADFNTISNGIPVLSEEGGDVNAVNVSSKYIYGTVKKRGLQEAWYKDALAKDNRPGLLAEMAQELMTAVRDLREAEIQRLLLDQAGLNTVFPENADNASVESLHSQHELTYKTLLNLELKLKRDRVPMVTKMVYGSAKIDTKTIDSAWIVYIGSEIVNTIRDMKDAGGKDVFVPAHQYGGATKPLKNELGSIGKFRFIEVFNMQKFKGAGAVVGTATGDGEADQYSAYNTYMGKDADGNDVYNYDVFPLLIVGEDSFDIIDYSASNMKLQKAMPKVIPGLDPYGDKGTMSITWWVGMLVKRPERLSVIKCTVRY